MHGGARQPAAIDQAGMIEGVAKHRIVRSCQGSDQTDIGGEAAAENQTRGRLFPGSQMFFQPAHRRQVSRDQRGSAGPGTVAPGRSRGRPRQPGIGSQVQIIIRGEIQVLPATPKNVRSLSGC